MADHEKTFQAEKYMVCHLSESIRDGLSVAHLMPSSFRARQHWECRGQELIFVTPTLPIVACHVRLDGLTGDVVHQKCDNTESCRAHIRKKTLSAVFTVSCHDAEFRAPVPDARHSLSFSFSTLHSWKLQKPASSPRRSACKQNRTFFRMMAQP